MIWRQIIHGTVCALKQYIVIYICFEFEKSPLSLPSTKGLMNACIKLVRLSTSNKVKNHCNKVSFLVASDEIINIHVVKCRTI